MEEVTAGGDVSITSPLTQQSGDQGIGAHSPPILEYLVIAVCAAGSIFNAYQLVQYSRTLHRQSVKNPTTVLLVSQFSLDGFACVFGVVCFSLKISSTLLIGQTGSWLCGSFYSLTVVRVALTGSAVNLVLICVQLYAEIQHSVAYRKYFRMWMVWLAIVFAWVDGIVLNNPATLPTHIDGGRCYWDALRASRVGQVAFGVFGFVWRHFLPVFVLIFCYLRMIITVHQRCLASPGHVSSISLQFHQQQQPQQQHDTKGPVSHHLVTVVKTMTVISMYFIVAWTPPNIIQLYLIAIGSRLQSNRSLDIAMLIGLINIALGPVIHIVAEGKFSKRQKVVKVHSQTTDEQQAPRGHNHVPDVDPI